jgi:hypothetical protein
MSIAPPSVRLRLRMAAHPDPLAGAPVPGLR